MALEVSDISEVRTLPSYAMSEVWLSVKGGAVSSSGSTLPAGSAAYAWPFCT
ncbi:hypothetical protein AB0J72_45260 [Dactylosporangium sp. NPDC049742]|uniref:hypothetical protein n=1 Tax=Dactylosporangium sp. NPDC049742 TaxID=3154737 RepID=UPI0034309D92